MNLMDEFKKDMENIVENVALDNKPTENENVTTEGIMDIFRGPKWNIKTTLRVLKIVSEVTLANDDVAGFTYNVVMINYGDKVYPTAINRGIGILTAYLNTGNSRVIISKDYENPDLKYKSKHIRRFYNIASKYVEVLKKNKTSYENEMEKMFADGFAISYAKKAVKNAEDLKISISDKALIEKYISLVEKVAKQMSKEFYLVEEEPTLTVEQATEKTYIEQAQEVVIKLDEVIKEVKGSDSISVATVINNLMEEKLCSIKK